VARRTSLTSLKQISEINLTPLMDLTFILLITFIITFPLIEQGIPVNLPKARASEVVAPEARTITVAYKGDIFLDDIPISIEQLNVRMNELAVAEPDVSVLIRADERIQYGVVVKVLKVLHDAHIVKMALVTEAE
jgi:biopolymer transport protein ExbD